MKFINVFLLITYLVFIGGCLLSPQVDVNKNVTVGGLSCPADYEDGGYEVGDVVVIYQTDSKTDVSSEIKDALKDLLKVPVAPR